MESIIENMCVNCGYRKKVKTFEVCSACKRSIKLKKANESSTAVRRQIRDQEQTIAIQTRAAIKDAKLLKEAKQRFTEVEAIKQIREKTQKAIDKITRDTDEIMDDIDEPEPVPKPVANPPEKRAEKVEPQHPLIPHPKLLDQALLNIGPAHYNECKKVRDMTYELFTKVDAEATEIRKKKEEMVKQQQEMMEAMAKKQQQEVMDAMAKQQQEMMDAMEKMTFEEENLGALGKTMSSLANALPIAEPIRLPAKEDVRPPADMPNQPE